MRKVNLAIETGGISFRNPVLTASGTFGYGKEFEGLTDLGALGGLVTKGISPKPRFGNATPRICETASGMLNSIGLENVGVEGFERDKLPYLRQWPCPPALSCASHVRSLWCLRSQGREQRCRCCGNLPPAIHPRHFRLRLDHDKFRILLYFCLPFESPLIL